LAYKAGTQDTGGKIKRVVEVWRQRNIFELAIQDATEKRIQGTDSCHPSAQPNHWHPAEVDKSRTARSGGARLGGSLLGGSLFSNSPASSVPPELQSLAQLQSTFSRCDTTAQPLLQTADTEYTKLTDPNTPVPSPPVHAARLSALLKNLATAEGALDASLKARHELIASLEKLLEANKSKLAFEEMAHAELSSRRVTIEARKKDVEDGIMRGLSADASAATSSNQSTDPRPTGNDGSPEVEAFTPPPEVENFTPSGSPEPAYPADDHTYGQDFLESNTFVADRNQEQEPVHTEPAPSFEPPPALQTNGPAMSEGANMLLSSLTRPATNSPAATTDPRLKRRKMNHSSEMDDNLFSTGDGVGLDKDVAAMLGAQWA
jgi:regulator of Ty1 transposition protein 103